MPSSTEPFTIAAVQAAALALLERELKRRHTRGLIDLMPPLQTMEDLLFQLNVVTIDVPALRERKEEIPLLCSSVLQRIAMRRDAIAVRTTPSWPVVVGPARHRVNVDE